MISLPWAAGRVPRLSQVRCASEKYLIDGNSMVRIKTHWFGRANQTDPWQSNICSTVGMLDVDPSWSFTYRLAFFNKDHPYPARFGLEAFEVGYATPICSLWRRRSKSFEPEFFPPARYARSIGIGPRFALIRSRRILKISTRFLLLSRGAAYGWCISTIVRVYRLLLNLLRLYLFSRDWSFDWNALVRTRKVFFANWAPRASWKIHTYSCRTCWSGFKATWRWRWEREV
jgi:hypothetical protein